MRSERTTTTISLGWMAVGFGVAALGAALARRWAWRGTARKGVGLAEVMEHSPEPIIAHWGGRILRANPAAERLLGYGPGEMDGRPLVTIVAPEDRAAIAKRVEFMSSSFRPVPIREERLLARDGRIIWAEIAALPVALDSRPAIVAMAHDTTQRRLADEERRRLLAEAQAGVRLRDEFLAVASHELKTPVAALGLELDLLWRTLGGRIDELPEKLRHRLEALRPSLMRLSDLIDDLLDTSLVRAGELALHPEEIDLAALVRKEAARAHRRAPRSKSVIEIDAPQPVIGHWDPRRLPQIVSNLLDNAMKYGLGGPIEISVASDGVRALLSVRDHGVGIPPADQARIFQLFQRASSQSWGGLGLGLFLVRRMAEAHGGRVAVESTVGQGATFRVELPLAPQAAATEAGRMRGPTASPASDGARAPP